MHVRSDRFIHDEYVLLVKFIFNQFDYVENSSNSKKSPTVYTCQLEIKAILTMISTRLFSVPIEVNHYHRIHARSSDLP